MDQPSLHPTIDPMNHPRRGLPFQQKGRANPLSRETKTGAKVRVQFHVPHRVLFSDLSLRSPEGTQRTVRTAQCLLQPCFLHYLGVFHRLRQARTCPDHDGSAKAQSGTIHTEKLELHNVSEAFMLGHFIATFSKRVTCFCCYRNVSIIRSSRGKDHIIQSANQKLANKWLTEKSA